MGPEGEENGSGEEPSELEEPRTASPPTIESDSSSPPSADEDDNGESSGSESTRSSTPVPEGQYEVETILNYTKDPTGHLYLVKWKGWDEEFNTWEPSENLHTCDDALITFYLKRRKEIEDIIAKSEYVETTDGKRRRKGPAMKLQLPPDPRPIMMIAQEFYDATVPPTYDEIKECESKWLAIKNAERLALNAKSKKKSSGSTFVWPLSKITKILQDGITGKLNDSEIANLRTQLQYYDFDRRQMQASESLQRWEKRINEISQGDPVIKVENFVDLEGPPIGFTYVKDYVPGRGITIPDDPPVGCSCDTKSCYDNRSSCCAVQFGSTFAYTPHKKLKVPVGTPIYECNSKCGCGDDCPNRVVQHGSKQLRLAIYRTPTGMGWGVKTLKKIKRGAFVSLYVGEVIGTEEAERRGREYDAEGCTYLFDLDFNEGDTCPYTVDAAKFGNVAHFINHSCDPNLAVFSVWVNCLDPNLPKLALFAIKDIGQGEELFFDYKNDLNKDGTEKTSIPNGVGPTSPTKSTTQTTERKACLCGSEKCRKFLF